jgi:putative peptidoglycan lipid II flippase
LGLDYRNIGKLLSLNSLNVLLNVAYSTLTVYYFGTSKTVEAFFAASVLGTAISRFVQTGQLVEIVVPRYHKIRQEISHKAAMSVIATLCNFMVGIAFLLVLIFVASRTLIIDLLVPGFAADTKTLVWEIFCVTGFLMPIQIATNLFQGMLNAENIYGKVEFTNTISLALSILILVIWGHNDNVWALTIGLVISVLAQFATTVYYLRQINYRHSFVLRNPYFPLRELFRAVAATSAYMGSVQVYTFVFNASLSLLPTGTFALYRYAELIYGKVANIFMMPVSTVFFNDINRLLNQENGRLVKGFVVKNLNLSYFLCFVILLPFWAGGEYFIWTLWGGIKFDAHDVHRVYWLLCVFFAAMIVNGPYMIFRKLAVSVSQPNLLYYLWAITHLLSCLLGRWLMHIGGFQGLLLQVFIHSFFMMLVPIYAVWRNKALYLGLPHWNEVKKITIALAAGVLVAWMMGKLWQNFENYDKLESILLSGALAGASALVFMGVSLYLKVQELELIRQKIQQFLKRV